MKIGIIATSLNEESSAASFLASILKQTRKPDEVIIVDGGSTDKTLSEIEGFRKKFTEKKIRFEVRKLFGNISECRNLAVKESNSEVIAVSDFGCILEKKWLERIAHPIEERGADVVAGYYKGLGRSAFEKCLTPFVLVMPDRVGKNFLPASRSMAIKKEFYLKMGGFSEELNYGEDYDFAKKLKKAGARIYIEKKAVVGWIPRKNPVSAFKMFNRYAFGDAKAGNYRPKVILLLVRYSVGVLVLLSLRYLEQMHALLIFLLFFFSYSAWAVVKNYKYIRSYKALFYLPFIQFIADIAVITGTISALTLVNFHRMINFIKREKITSFSIFVFIILTLSVINWGLPNVNHPFTYHMDEWHQLQSIRNLFTHLSPNMQGSANGPIFHFLLSGFYLFFLTLIGLFDPFIINSSVANLETQNSLFVYLRLSSLFFALGSAALLIFILKKQIRVKFLYIPVILFLFSPIWISLSNYFKYDIALVFWILLSVVAIFKFKDSPSLKNYLLASIPVALAVCTKISALPLVLVYLFSFFIFRKKSKHYVYLLYGALSVTLIFLLLGIPDLLIGKGNYYEYFHSNLIRTPNETFNYNLKSHYLIYLFTNQIPTLFGYVFLVLFPLSLAIFIFRISKTKPKEILRKYKIELFLLFAVLVFALSLVPMKLFIINRSLVVLPFLVLFISLIIDKFARRRVIFFIILIILFFHMIQGASWVETKFNDPRREASSWMKSNIKEKETIGIENVPIYQFLPDLIVMEYYLNEFGLGTHSIFSYSLVSKESEILPNYIVLSNADIDLNYIHSSSKKELLYRIDGSYRLAAVFKANRNLNSFFTNRLDFYISLLSPVPNIYIYKKQ